MFTWLLRYCKAESKKPKYSYEGVAKESKGRRCFALPIIKGVYPDGRESEKRQKKGAPGNDEPEGANTGRRSYELYTCH